MAYNATSTTMARAYGEESYYYPQVGHIRFYSEADRLKFLEFVKLLLQERIDKLSLKPNDVIIVENLEAAEAIMHVTRAQFTNEIVIVRDGDIRTMTDEEVCQLLNRIT